MTVEVLLLNTQTPSHLLVCPQRLAADVGQAIFEAGGNAADAAVAVAFAQGVVDPFMTSIGGTSTAMIWDAKRRDLYTLNCASETGSVPPPASWIENARGTLETVGRFGIAGNENQVGYRSIMVPGAVRGAQELYERLGSGRIPWGDLLQPAIGLASDGFEVSPYLARGWTGGDEPRAAGGLGAPSFDEKIAATPDATAIFLKEGKHPYQVGDRLVQRDLGETLRTLAREGAESFYTGSISKIIAEDFKQHGALISESDLNNYRAKIRRPVSTTYRGYEVLTNPAPARGVPMLSMLDIIEGWNLTGLGWNSAAYTDRLSAAMRCAFRDYGQYGDDPDYVDVPLDLIVSKERGAMWRAAIEAGTADSPVGDHGIPPGTTHITATDAEGNIVLWTHSIGSIAGSGVVTPGLGFLYSNFLGFFNPLPNQPRSLVPGKRTAGGASTLVLKDGQPFLALGSPGGSRIVSAVLQSILNVIEHGMSMQEAVSVPRFHSEEAGKLFVEPSCPQDVSTALTSGGYDVQRTTYMACVQALRIDPESGQLTAGADPRAEGGVAFWSGAAQ